LGREQRGDDAETYRLSGLWKKPAVTGIRRSGAVWRRSVCWQGLTWHVMVLVGGKSG
jgi:hypothetical protein